MTDQEHFQLVTAIISAGSGMFGVIIGSSVTVVNGYLQRRRAGIRQKLEEFYGPMLAIRARIKAKSELRLRLSSIAGEEWAKLFSTGKADNPETSKKIDHDRWPEYQRLIEQANEETGSEIIPAYKEMVDVFVAKLYLANEVTRSFFSVLVEHVAVLDMYFKSPLPREVARRLDHSEKKLDPFYEELEKQFVTLQKQLG